MKSNHSPLKRESHEENQILFDKYIKYDDNKEEEDKLSSYANL